MTLVNGQKTRRIDDIPEFTETLPELRHAVNERMRLIDEELESVYDHSRAIDVQTDTDVSALLIYKAITTDSGTATADTNADTASIVGGEGIDTSASADAITITGEDATTSNKGIASFAAAHFDVASGAVSLDATLKSGYDGAVSHVTADGTSHSAVTGNTTDIGTNVTAIGLNTTHRGSAGTDHSDVGLNNTHRGSAGTDHSDVGLNNTHRGSNGSDHPYLDQAVTIAGTPTFASTTIVDGGTAVELGSAAGAGIVASRAGGYFRAFGAGDVKYIEFKHDDTDGEITTSAGDLKLTPNGGDVNITGNIIISGTVDGIDIATDVAANTTHRGLTNNPHSVTAAQVVTNERFSMWHDESTQTAGAGSHRVVKNTNQIYLYYSDISAANNADAFTNGCYLAAGTYTFSAMGIRSSGAGKIDWTIDGDTIVTGQDWYAGATAYNVVKVTTSVSVATSGWHTVLGTINGKHASSSGYAMLLTKFWFKQASD